MSSHRTIEAPEGWTIDYSADGQCFTATHEDFDASYKGPEDGWIGNGLFAIAWSVEALLSWIEEIEAEHPHFQEVAQ